MQYRDQKRLDKMKEAMEPKSRIIQKLYDRNFVVENQPASEVESCNTDRDTNRAPSEYHYRDWREIMHHQQESLRSLVSLGVVDPM